MSRTILNLPVAIEGAIEMSVLPQEASTRLFYRIKRTVQPDVIFMQLTDDSHSIADIVKTNEILHACNIPSFEILNYSVSEKWLLQTDLGRITLLSHLHEENAQLCYQKAIDHIITLQTHPKEADLPSYGYDDFVREASLFIEHFLPTISPSPNLIMQAEFTIKSLAQELAEIPTVKVHKDFHSTNIMVGKNQQLAIIDQQDMCMGPMTYDLASILYDCYIDWPEDVIGKLTTYFCEHYPSPILLETFSHQIKLTALQRHLKCLGLFCRLAKQGKVRYLNYLPRLKNRIILFSKHLPHYGIFRALIENTL